MKIQQVILVTAINDSGKNTSVIKRNLSIQVFAALCFFLASCLNQDRRIIIPPEPLSQSRQFIESWELTDSQNGKSEALIPEWVSLYLDGKIHEIENSNKYSDKYIFVGDNRGDNFVALRQWASAFTVQQDMPRLAAIRIENRMVSAATLYPDDEYGDFYEAFIKASIDAEYPDAIIEDRFWIKRRILIRAEDTAPEENPSVTERYDFLILISADRTEIQNTIRAVMDGIKTAVRPTRDQSAAINRIKQTFFERF